ncbi:hypothetical protein THOM_2992, partial [Trachipleistophora hominis]
VNRLDDDTIVYYIRAALKIRFILLIDLYQEINVDKLNSNYQLLIVQLLSSLVSIK